MVAFGFTEVVTNDACIAIGSLELYGEVYGADGTSKRNPIDEPDEELALLLAYARVLGSLSRQLQKAANVRENELARIAAQKHKNRLQGTPEALANEMLTVARRHEAKTKLTGKSKAKTVKKAALST